MPTPDHLYLTPEGTRELRYTSPAATAGNWCVREGARPGTCGAWAWSLQPHARPCSLMVSGGKVCGLWQTPGPQGASLSLKASGSYPHSYFPFALTFSRYCVLMKYMHLLLVISTLSGTCRHVRKTNALSS